MSTYKQELQLDLEPDARRIHRGAGIGDAGAVLVVQDQRWSVVPVGLGSTAYDLYGLCGCEAGVDFGLGPGAGTAGAAVRSSAGGSTARSPPHEPSQSRADTDAHRRRPQSG